LHPIAKWRLKSGANIPLLTQITDGQVAPDEIKPQQNSSASPTGLSLKNGWPNQSDVWLFRISAPFGNAIGKFAAWLNIVAIFLRKTGIGVIIKIQFRPWSNIKIFSPDICTFLKKFNRTFDYAFHSLCI